MDADTWNRGGHFCSFYESAFAHDYFLDDRAFITGSGYPSGSYKKKSGHFLANGDWKYATGAPHATLFTARCYCAPPHPKNSNPHSEIILAFYPQEITIKPTWNSYGLKATASHNFSVRNVRVPEERMFKLTPDHLHVDAPLYHFPFESFAQVTLGASLLGIGHHFIEEVDQFQLVHKPEDKSFKRVIKSAKRSLDQAEKQFVMTVDEAWGYCKANHSIKDSQKKIITKVTKDGTRSALDAARKLYDFCRMAILEETSPMNQAWRDLHTASQHGMLNAKVDVPSKNSMKDA